MGIYWDHITTILNNLHLQANHSKINSNADFKLSYLRCMSCFTSVTLSYLAKGDHCQLAK